MKKFLALIALSLTACGDEIDTPDCHIPFIGDTCYEPSRHIKGEDWVAYCNDRGRISGLFYMVENEEGDPRMVRYDDKCFDNGSCYLLTMLCR